MGAKCDRAEVFRGKSVVSKFEALPTAHRLLRGTPAELNASATRTRLISQGLRQLCIGLAGDDD